MKDVKITYRGWPGHFICGDRCVFHLNTLLEYKEIKIVVSTVDMMKKFNFLSKQDENKEFEEIGFNRYFETMAFHAEEKNGDFIDANVSRQVDFESEWAWNLEDEWKANKGHWAVVDEIKQGLLDGKIY